jgi:hypothetical protein
VSVLPNKILTSALLLIVAVPLFLSISYVVKQRSIQQQMKEKLELTSVQSITVDPADITWVKKDKEAIINGQLFDIKSISITGNKLVLKGLFDNEEDQLISDLKNSVNQQKENGATSSQLHCIFLPLFSEDYSISIQNNWAIVSNSFTNYNKFMPEGYLSSILRPPRFS